MGVLIVDGYNVVHAWPALKRTLQTRGLADARRELVHALSEYAAHTDTTVTVVFDSHDRLPSNEPAEVIDGVTVLYGTKTASADHVIERLAQRSARRGAASDVTVATGDNLQRALVGAMGVATISAASLAAEVQRAAGDVTHVRRQQDQSVRHRRVEEHLSPDARRKLDAIWGRTPADPGAE